MDIIIFHLCMCLETAFSGVKSLNFKSKHLQNNNHNVKPCAFMPMPFHCPRNCSFSFLSICGSSMITIGKCTPRVENQTQIAPHPQEEQFNLSHLVYFLDDKTEPITLTTDDWVSNSHGCQDNYIQTQQRTNQLRTVK